MAPTYPPPRQDIQPEEPTLSLRGRSSGGRPLRRRSLSILAVLVLVGGACDATPSSAPASPGASSVAAASQGTGTETSGPGQPSAPRSEALIAAALEAGAITLEQSLVYRALALFGSPELPEPYRSDFPDLDAATFLLRDIELHESELSAEALAKLEPFRVRPTEPNSIYSTATASAGSLMLAAATTPGWHTDVVPGTAARIWIPDASFSDAAMGLYKSLIRTAWEQLPGVFRYPKPDEPEKPSAAVNPDALIDFYFVDVGAIDPRYDECVKELESAACRLASGEHGYAVAAEKREGVTSSGYLVFDRAKGADDMLDTIAHELTHAGQFAYDRNETSWLSESTATWAAFRVMQKVQKEPSFEHGLVDKFMANVDGTLPGIDGYQSWVFFLFVSMQRGDAMIESIWQEAAQEGEQGEKAVDARFPFAEHLDDFSVRNWNSEPVEPLYVEADRTFPVGAQPDLYRDLKVDQAQEDLLDANVVPLSMVYYHYRFNSKDSKVRKIAFENAYAGLPDAHVWAIRKIKDTWATPQEWTAEPRKSFCRDIVAEDVTELILIVSNSSLTDPLRPQQPAKLTTQTTGCEGWSGTMTATKTWNYSEGLTYTGTTTATFTGVWQADDSGRVLIGSPCNSQPSPCVIFVPTGTIDWTWKSDWPTKPPCHADTSGSLPAGGLDLPERQAFVLARTDATHFRFFGRGDTNAPRQDCANPIDSGGNPPMFFQLPAQASSTIPLGRDGNTCISTDWIIEASATTISGSCYDFNYDYHTLKYEWNLTRVGAGGQ